MSFNTNTKTLNQQFEGLSLKSESKYDEDTLDEAIINGLKGEYRDFCKNIEQFLNQFMKSSKTNDVIPDLNKYQRKIVHKICDLYCITREYVDVKSDESGSITITKQDKSFIPSTTIEERYQKHVGKTKKSESGKSANPFANKKVIIKSRATAQPDLKTPSDKSEKSSVSATDNATQGGNLEDAHLEIEHKKKKEYEEARNKIMQGHDQDEDQNAQNRQQQQGLKKGKRYEKGYDPEFDRSRGQDMGMFMGPGMMGMGPMNPVPGLGMPGMHGMNPMPGMGYYPPYMQPQFYPGPGMFPNQNYGGGPSGPGGPGGNPSYIMPFPGQNQNQNQNQSQNQQQIQNQGQGQNQGPPGFSTSGGQSNGYYQNFPGLDKGSNKK